MEMQPHSEPDVLPEHGVLLGVDFGTKRLGISISDRDQKFASPLHNQQRQGPQGDARFFRKIIEEFNPVGILVGLPVHMSGDESRKSREARAFGKWLQQTTGLPVGFHDERYTTALADGLLFQTDMSSRQRKAKRDKLAAQILLQNFLRSRNQQDPDAD
jgi:putative Holliday junction resolvase